MRSKPNKTLVKLRNCSSSLLLRSIFPVLILCSCLSYTARAQAPAQRLNSLGKVPADFISFTPDTPASDRRRQSRLQMRNAFEQQSAYTVQQLLQSGRIIFHDSISLWLGNIARTLLPDRPELLARLRFYLVKSPEVNAYSTDEGIVLINLGLLARMENEAQLAFILAHEMAHIQLGHAWELYAETEIRRERSGRRNAFPAGGVPNAAYSQEKEAEADREALRIFLKTDYDPLAAIRVFDLLDLNELSFSDTLGWAWTFPAYFGSDRIPRTGPILYQAPSVAPRRQEFLERQRALEARLRNRPLGRRELWVCGEKIFRLLKWQCQVECAFLLYIEKKYEQSLYASLHLLNDSPQNAALQRVRMFSLYALAMYAHEGRFWDIPSPGPESSAQMQQMHAFLEGTAPGELILIGLLNATALQALEPQDPAYETIAGELIRKLAATYDLANAGDGLACSPQWLRALAHLRENGSFERVYQQTMQDLASGNVTPKDVPSSHASADTWHLGIERLVWVDPFFRSIDRRNQDAIDFWFTEHIEREMLSAILASSSRLSVHSRILSFQHLGEDSLRLFNDLILLTEWLREKGDPDHLPLLSIQQSAIEEMISRHGCPYFIWLGWNTHKLYRQGRPAMVAAGVILPVMLPYSLYYAASPEYRSRVYMGVFDLRAGKYLVIYPQYLRVKPRRDLVRTHIYDLIYRLNQP